MVNNKRGQSTIEYILLVAAVIAVLIFFVGTRGQGMQKKVNQTLEHAGSDMLDRADVLGKSHTTEPGAASTVPSGYKVDIVTPMKQ